ncbi:MAG: thioredoxin domain-containing protein [Alphaproteobacteria bacterium]|nr:thioredoxin domain-containing protein [Alphaproteobacteria bacterium]
MVREHKIALGLLVTLLIIPTALAAKDRIIGSYNKSETAQTSPKDTPSNSGNETAKGQGTPSSQVTETATTQTSFPKETGASGETTPAIATKGQQSTGDLSDSELERKIGEFITNNPEIIVSSLQKLNQKQERAQQEKLEASLTQYKGSISKDSGAILLGKKDAEVKLVVFIDPNCAHCRLFTQALTKVREGFPNVGVLYRPWAIMGPESNDVARGLWAIKQQGQDKFNAVFNAIASSKEVFTYAKLLAWAEENKLDIAKFKADTDSKSTKEAIEDTKKLANDIGLLGTPTSLLVDKKGIRLVVPTDENSLHAILKGAASSEPQPS